MADKLSDIQSLADAYSSLSDDRNADILEYVKLNQELNSTLLTNEKQLQNNITLLRKHSALKSIEAEIAARKEAGEDVKNLEEQAAAEKERIATVAAQAASRQQLVAYQRASAQEKKQMQKDRAEKLKASISSTKEEYTQRIALAEAADDEITANNLREEQDRKVAALKSAEEEAKAREKALESALKGDKKPNKVQEWLQNKQEAFQQRKQTAHEDYDSAVNGMAEAIKSGSDEQIKAAREQLRAAEAELKAVENQEALAEAQQKAAAQMAAFTSGAIQDALNLITEYKGAMDSRLQGSEKDYKSIVDKATTMLSVNPFVESKKVVDAMKRATEEGIVYNIEQRAFLNEISNKIADTFDAFDSNLTRLIRLQQSDSTAARLGMEATLTKLFNKMFEDNSYLNGVSDSVSAALLEASAMMSREVAAEFEFTVQKWLGALYSLGLSENTVTQIAQGLTYIATGDVMSMANNTNLQTLFTMAASKAGLDYAQLFVDGLDSSETNNLLGSIVGYIKEIAENSDNNVVRAAYGDIFNVHMSDLRAISNMTQEEIVKLSELTYNYSQMLEETNSQLSFSNMWNRSSLGTMMETVYRNATFGMGMDLAANPATFALYKLTSYMNQENLEMAIPFINAMGFGLDLNTNIEDIMKLALGLTGAMSIGANIFLGLAQGGGFTLGSWDAAETTHRGGSLNFNTDTGTVDTGATYVGNQSSDDMKQSSLEDATADAEETGKTTNKDTKTEYVFDDFYNAVIVGTPSDKWLRSYDFSLSQVLDTSSHYLSIRDSRMSFNNDNLQVEDAQFKFTSSGQLETHDANSDSGLDHIENISSTLKEIKKAVNSMSGESSPISSLVTLLSPSTSEGASDVALSDLTSTELERVIIDALNSVITSAQNNPFFGG